MRHRQVYRAAMVICFALVALSACASPAAEQSRDDARPAGDVAVNVAPTTSGGRRQATGDAESAVSGEWGLRGEGSETTDPFPLPAGQTIVEFKHAGFGPFTVDLVDTSGIPVQRIAAATGPWSATKTLAGTPPGTYSIRVVTEGAWELLVRYPEDAPAESAP